MCNPYSTFEEKAKDFSWKRVNTIEELENLVMELKKCNSKRFRGVSESKYHMLTSLQRQCPDGITNKEYMHGLLAQIKGDADVRKFFETHSITINDLSCISLMQHMGLPTPFLDFTIDVNIALAFAADGADRNEKKTAIDDYCSLYYFDLEKEMEIQNSKIQEILRDGISKCNQMCNEHYKAYPNDIINKSNLEELDKYIKWDDLANIQLAYVEYQDIAPLVCTFSSQILDLTNPNLAKQKGGFVINLYKDETPLEENWNMRTSERRNKILSNCSSLPFSGIYTYHQIGCVDIKKDVILEWNKRNPIELYDTSQETEKLKEMLSTIKDSYEKPYLCSK